MFTIKDVEKKAAAAGIIAQAVKDVLKERAHAAAVQLHVSLGSLATEVRPVQGSNADSLAPCAAQELIGDDLVREDKCGVSTYYWAFPGLVPASLAQQ